MYFSQRICNMAETQKGIGDGVKKYKTMILFVLVFAVLAALYFVMNHVNKLQAEKELNETIMVTELGDLAYMEYTNGETVLSFVKEGEVWGLADDSETSTTLDSDAVETIADTLSQVPAVRVLKGAGELSEYGLDKPTYTIKLKTESGTEVTLYIGNTAGENYYATTGDKMVVYVIDSSPVDVLEFDATALEAEDTLEE